MTTAPDGPDQPGSDPRGSGRPAGSPGQSGATTDADEARRRATPVVPTTRAALAKIIDHTLLRPDATDEDILKLCAQAEKLGVGTVCVAPTHVFLTAASARRGGDDGRPAFAVASVVGFPHGTHLTVIKAEEARRAVADGATEIDMVIDIANAMDENWRAIETEITDIRLSVPPHITLKVILETALLPDMNIRMACRAALAGGAGFVKTSTGFHPAGGASLRAVRAMHSAVGGRLGIKASGGIRTASQALAFLQAGATRLGLSATADILDEMPK